MTSTLRTLLQELDRPDLDDEAKQVIQLEIERFLGRNSREVLRGLEASPPLAVGEYKLEAHCVACGVKIPGTELGYCGECQQRRPTMNPDATIADSQSPTQERGVFADTDLLGWSLVLRPDDPNKSEPLLIKWTPVACFPTRPMAESWITEATYRAHDKIETIKAAPRKLECPLCHEAIFIKPSQKECEMLAEILRCEDQPND